MTGSRRRAALVGTGLIGGSVGMALRANGWHVTGTDRDDRSAARALELGAVDAVGSDPSRGTDRRRRSGRVDPRDRPSDPRTGRRRHRRRERQAAGGQRGRPPPVRRWSPDGGLRSDRHRRCPTGPLRRSDLGPDPEPPHRPRGAQPGQFGRAFVRRRRDHPRSRRPRPVGRHRVARPSPHCCHPDGPRRHPVGGARCAVAPGGRRLPRHDAASRPAIRGSGSTSAPTTGPRSSMCWTICWHR